MSDTDSVFDNWKKLRREISEQRLPNAMTELTIAIESNAVEQRAPVATATLAESAYHDLEKTSTGWRGSVGFLVNYAYYVHEAEGKLLNTKTPRHPKTLGYVWGGYSGKAEPKFLENAADYIVESGQAQKILEDNLE